jgi:hypothetical protein
MCRVTPSSALQFFASRQPRFCVGYDFVRRITELI